jgi:hypothetical protein
MHTAETFEVKEALSKTPKQIVLEEIRAEGSLDYRHWWEVLAFTGGPLFYSVLVVLLLASTLFPVAERRVLE